jgi:lysophospholipase L1-like esterase
MRSLILFLGLLVGSTPVICAQSTEKALPKVVLLGDSIRLGYTPYVEKQLAGQAVVISPKANGGDSGRVLKNLEEWAIREQPAVVHFNCGIHDTKKSKTTGKFQVPPDEYAANLRNIVGRLRRETKAVVIFALTTPVDDARAAQGRQKVDYELLEASAAQYNEIARGVMKELDVPVNDLRAALGNAEEQKRLQGGDGIHFTTAGSEKLGTAVAAAIRGQLKASVPATDPAKCDVVIYGGTSGGVIAAVQAARLGKRVVLIEPSRHLGGMTSGGLGATDFKNPDSVGGLSREFYQRVRKHYANPTAWKYERPEAFKSARYDPTADVMWHFEPHVAENILSDLVREAGVNVVYGQRLDLRGGVQKSGPHIQSIRMESGQTFAGHIFIDATYEGDLMAKAGVSYTIGREANSVYGETLNGVQTRRVPYNGHSFFRPISPYVIPGNPASGLLFGVQKEPPGEEGGGDRRVQAYCYRICLTEVPENRVPFTKPEGYDANHYELLLRYLLADGAGKLFPDHPQPRPIESPALGYNPYTVIMPNRKTDSNSKGAISSNLVGGNYEYPDGDYATRERIIRDHIRWHQGLLWFMQNDPRVPAAYREPLQSWGFAKDEFADTNHWPHQIYVREARRMIGEYVMTEYDCNGTRKAEDSVGLGCYTMDSHVTERYVDSQGWVRNEGNLGGRVPQPYPIIYRALTPKKSECDNLLVPVCCSASHVGYSSIRMEPVYMILGQAAGTAAALASDDRTAVQTVSYSQLRDHLLRDGQRITWPLPPSSKASQ